MEAVLFYNQQTEQYIYPIMNDDMNEDKTVVFTTDANNENILPMYFEELDIEDKDWNTVTGRIVVHTNGNVYVLCVLLEQRVGFVLEDTPIPTRSDWFMYWASQRKHKCENMVSVQSNQSEWCPSYVSFTTETTLSSHYIANFDVRAQLDFNQHILS